MICPKCDEGEVKEIQFKKSNKTASFCEYCGTLWLKNETISDHSGHAARSYMNGEDREYTYDLSDGNNAESEPLIDVKYK